MKEPTEALRQWRESATTLADKRGVGWPRGTPSERSSRTTQHQRAVEPSEIRSGTSQIGPVIGSGLARCQTPLAPSIRRSRVAFTRSGTYEGVTVMSSAAANREPPRSDFNAWATKLCSSHGLKKGSFG